MTTIARAWEAFLLAIKEARELHAASAGSTAVADLLQHAASCSTSLTTRSASTASRFRATFGTDSLRCEHTWRPSSEVL